MRRQQLINEYAAGPEQLRQAVAGMSEAQLDAAPIPGRWSTRQVVSHIADFELVYADRIKRVIATDEPELLSGCPDAFAARLAYDQRDVKEELQLIEAVRRHEARILRSLDIEDFQRIGLHSEDGPLSLETLLRRIEGHIPHHVKFIEEKRKALEAS